MPNNTRLSTSKRSAASTGRTPTHSIQPNFFPLAGGLRDSDVAQSFLIAGLTL